jgi:hypothetical protein
MALVTETIHVVNAGPANPSTKDYSIVVDTTTGAGTAPLSIPILGTNAGNDSITATMTSHAGVPVSNTANISWQATNGPIAVTPFTIDTYSNNSMTRGWPGSLQTASSDQGRTAFPYHTPNCNSLVFNEVQANTPISPFCLPNNVSGCGGGYKTNPMVALQQTTGGGWASNTVIQGTNDNNNSGNFPGYVLNFSTNLIVKTAGTYTFYMNYANVSSCALWVGGGATFSSQNFNGGNTGNAFPATSPKNGYKLAIAATNMSAIAHPNAVSSYITFPTPGVYPIEVVYNQYLSCQFSYDNNSFWQLTYLSGAQNQNVGQSVIGSQNFPVAIATAPPAGAAPTGALRLTPTGGAAGLKVQGQTDTLTLTVQNIVYASIPYIPILEGTAGSLFVYNSGTAFNFQTYNGFPVNTTAAASSVFTITGSNTSGIFNVTPQGNHFLLNYTGGAFSFIGAGAQIASTDLTLTADDIAWYDGTAGPEQGTFDLFSPVGGSGGIAYSVDVDFMTKPTVKSVSPTSLQADGKNQSFSITLSKPMSPQQQGLYGTGNTVVPSASLTGGATFQAPLTPILDGQGYLQGWSTLVNVPINSNNGSITLTFNLSGTLTYLSGTTFVTGTVNYIVNSMTVIPTVGDQFVNPVAVSLAISPGGSPLTAAQTLTGTVYTFDNNPLTMEFQHKSTAAGSTAVNVGAGVLSNSFTSTVGGKTAYNKVFTFGPFTVPQEPSGSTLQNFGFIATDTVSGLATTYFSSTVYTFPLIPGGGGGGGCPAVEMFLDDWHQVSDVFEGMGVETLAGETSDYVGGVVPTTETRQVQWFDFDTQVCYRLRAANGCEVIVSSSTPVPTLESIEAHAAGLPIEAGFANEVRVGMHVVTEIDMDAEGDRVEWSPLVEVECLGMRRVARVYCGGRNFAAGTKPGRYIYTHNLLPIVPK